MHFIRHTPWNLFVAPPPQLIVREISMRTLLLTLSLAMLASPGSASLITNGSFESGPTPGGYLNLCPGSTVITGWVVTHGALNYMGGLWVAAEGQRSLDLDGSSACAGDVTGGIAQTFATVPGSSYSVSFKLAGNPGGSPTVKIVRVTAAGQQADFSFDVTGKTYGNMGWVLKEWTFVANAGTTTLEFFSVNTAGYGPAVDDVVVDGVTPVAPSSWGRIKVIYR